LGKIGDGSDNLQIGLCLEQRTQPLAHQAIVVDDQDPNPLRQESLRVCGTIRKGRGDERGARRATISVSCMTLSV